MHLELITQSSHYELRSRGPGRPANPPAGVLVVEDHPLMASSIRARLGSISTEEGWPMAITLAGSLRRASEVLGEGWQPRLVVADLHLPDSDGLETLCALKRLCDAPILVFSGSEAAGSDTVALEMGAAAVLSKLCEGSGFIDMARQLLGFGPRQQGPGPTPEQLVSKLTHRQRAVLAQVAAGRTNREVADALNIQVSTVHTHLSTVMQVLGASNRTQVSMAYARWVQEGRDALV